MLLTVEQLHESALLQLGIRLHTLHHQGVVFNLKESNSAFYSIRSKIRS